MITIVVQFGLATIPASMSVERVRVDLADDERHARVHAPGARVVDDDRAGGGEARRPLARGPAAGGEQREVEAADLPRRERPHDADARQISRPAERSEANGTISLAREAARGEHLEHDPPDGAGRADDGDARPAALIAAPPNGSSAMIVSSPSSPNAACSPRTASGTRSPSITQEILIGEVEIISMLMPASPSTVNTVAATPGWLRMPAPTIETFPIDSSAATCSIPSSPTSASSASRAIAPVLARDGERHVGAAAAGERLVLDDHVDVDVGVGERAEDAPGDARLVGDAEQRDPRLGGRVGDGGDERVFHRFLLGDDNGTGSVLEARTAVDAHAVVARVLDRAQLQHAGARGRHLEHLLEGHDRQLARAAARSAGRR